MPNDLDPIQGERRGPDPETMALINGLKAQLHALEAALRSKLDASALDNFVIHQGQRVTISGQGRNITISANDQSGGGGAANASNAGFTGPTKVCLDLGEMADPRYVTGTGQYANGLLISVHADP